MGENNLPLSHHLDPGLRTVHKGYLLSSNAPNHYNDANYLVQALFDPSYPSKTLANYEDYSIDPSKLSIKTPLAQGAFGRIYVGSYNNDDVVIKLLEMHDQDDPTRPQLMEQQIDQEITMLTKLKHQNVVRFIGACKKKNVWCIVTEHEKRGSVRQFLSRRNHTTVPLKLVVGQALDMARGMAYVHEMGFIHRDLKSDNLLISVDKHVKIAGFTVARIEVKTSGMSPETGTYRWMAPEMIQHRPYDQKVDVYSFGIVLWELITGRIPFDKMTAVQAAFAVVNRGARPIIPQDCHPMLSELMTRCWDADPLARPCFTEIVRILEQVETEIITVIRRARFRSAIFDGEK